MLSLLFYSSLWKIIIREIIFLVVGSMLYVDPVLIACIEGELGWVRLPQSPSLNFIACSVLPAHTPQLVQFPLAYRHSPDVSLLGWDWVAQTVEVPEWIRHEEWFVILWTWRRPLSCALLEELFLSGTLFHRVFLGQVLQTIGLQTDMEDLPGGRGLRIRERN